MRLRNGTDRQELRRSRQSPGAAVSEVLVVDDPVNGGSPSALQTSSVMTWKRRTAPALSSSLGGRIERRSSAAARHADGGSIPARSQEEGRGNNEEAGRLSSSLAARPAGEIGLRKGWNEQVLNPWRPRAISRSATAGLGCMTSCRFTTSMRAVAHTAAPSRLVPACADRRRPTVLRHRATNCRPATRKDLTLEGTGAAGDQRNWPGPGASDQGRSEGGLRGDIAVEAAAPSRMHHSARTPRLTGVEECAVEGEAQAILAWTA